MERVSVTDAARRFADFVNRVVYRRGRFVLVRGGRDVAELSPVAAGRSLSELPGLLSRLPRLTAAEAESLGTDLERAASELRRGEERDPWVSRSTHRY